MIEASGHGRKDRHHQGRHVGKARPLALVEMLHVVWQGWRRRRRDLVDGAFEGASLCAHFGLLAHRCGGLLGGRRHRRPVK